MRLTRRLNKTYQKLYRNRHLVATQLELDDAEYRLWDLYTALYDWDQKHTETFGTVEATDKEIADILLWSSSKVCRTRNRLLEKQVVTPIKKSGYRIFPSLELKNSSTDTQEKIANVHDGNASMKQDIALVQQNRDHTSPSSIVSYKDKYKFTNTKEEYQRIKFQIEELAGRIDDRWFDSNPEVQKLVGKHQVLAHQMLYYEIENNLLPI